LAESAVSLRRPSIPVSALPPTADILYPVPLVTTLILTKTASHYGGDWFDTDYVVLDGDRVIGRIMLHPQAPVS
jgi:hypothetical protein